MASRITDTTTWTTSIHSRNGNLLLGDGSVQQLTTVGLQKQSILSDQIGGADNNHTRIPQ